MIQVGWGFNFRKAGATVFAISNPFVTFAL